MKGRQRPTVQRRPVSFPRHEHLIRHDVIDESIFHDPIYHDRDGDGKHTFLMNKI